MAFEKEAGVDVLYGERVAEGAAPVRNSPVKSVVQVAFGNAVRMWKNAAGDDQDGGLVILSLLQPRKPDVETPVHPPVAGHQIRGNSAVSNELDVHLSAYRAWVKRAEVETTPWGRPAGRRDPNRNRPKLARSEAEGDKLDDEHMYLKIDKDRVSGEGPTTVLDFDNPSGRVYERRMVERGYRT